jgi:hypothetical protein
MFCENPPPPCEFNQIYEPDSGLLDMYTTCILLVHEQEGICNRQTKMFVLTYAIRAFSAQ